MKAKMHGKSRVGKAVLALTIAGTMMVGGSGIAHAQEEEPGEHGDLIGAVDDVLDGATCEGPLGGLLTQVINCNPEDEPPFQSYENGEF